MDIQVENLQDLLPINNNSVVDVVKGVLNVENKLCDEVMVYFVDEQTICKVHDDHFNDPSPTDCISIQVDNPGSTPCFLGEIFVSPKAAIDYCKSNKGQIYQELTLYLVHGMLHLLGYDDIENDDEAKMRLAEKKSIDYLLKCNKLICK
ncbi:MAG: Endoribonuclease YbeY [Chlamydiae bacterium]|nr:Endoribonuclease YbeY [Chlamydiota bacterium]